MSSSFILEFKRLSVHERTQALVALTAELTPYEWRALGAVISSQSFQFDIIGRLPVELVVRIFTYLDPAAPYRCQAVSRQWNHVLRSPQILKACLSSWHQGTVHLQDADYDMCRTKSRRIHAFRTGNPQDIYKFNFEDNPKICVLAGDSLVWQTEEDSRSAYLLNLDTWYFRNLFGQGRERIRSVFASDEIMVLTTHTNTCYVYELHERRAPKQFSLPNQRYLNNMTCRGRTVACVAASDKYTSVFIWEFDTQRGKSFEIDHLTDALFSTADPRIEEPHPVPLVQPETKTIILFIAESSRPQHSPHTNRFAFSRYTYSGERIGIFLPSLPEVYTSSIWEHVTPFVPVDDSGTVFATSIKLGNRADNPDTNSPIPLRFDEETYEVRVWDHPLARFRGPRPSEIPMCFLAWWKDTCYGYKEDWASDTGDTLAYMGTRTAEAYAVIIPPPTNIYAEDGVDEPLLINEKYVIRIAYGCVYLLCFHESSNRPKENGAFFDLGELEVLQ